ncbi:MAG: hypothetical protein JSW72_07370 [Candidatus Bathyarchaeota archaeon]|nr:MAG: hypothetical protein JSW72_07370 [Candidatus Bathyarchaeota archaeon]
MVRRLFKRKKEEEKLVSSQRVERSQLDQVCGNDKDLSEALWHTMFYDPTKINMTLDEAAKKAAAFEKNGESRRARVWYHIAGGLALWKGNTSKVKQYFGKCEKLAPDMYYGMIVKIPEKAVGKAQEFYKKFISQS